MNGCSVLLITSHSGAFYEGSTFSLLNTGLLKGLGFFFLI